VALTIDSLSPSPVKVGWEGVLTIYGRELGEAGFVAIDGNHPKVDSWTTSRIEIKVTKDMTASAGDKRLVVHDKNGGFGETEWVVEA
jgi:hypothetical protein